MTYQPPCTISPPVERLLGRICEMVGRLSVSAQGEHLRLRRINRIRTIQGSLAIEGNTLSEEQITAIMDGRRVVAPPREIQEARNAIEVYDRLEQRDPYRETDLLAAHEIMMRSLMDAPGRYRTGGVGVMGRKEVIHVAPPAGRVPILMRDLFDWLNRGERHPLVASSIFHYEFEFIHPFADGNGRMGRLWQTLILARWNSIFAITPVESMVHARQQEYYEAIGQSTNMNDSAPFVEFMLEVIRETLGDMGSDQAADQVSDQVQRLLRLVDQEFVTVTEMMTGVGLSHRPTFRKNYLRPALDAGLLEMKYPENPKHPRQRYRLTSKGRSMKALLGEQ
ncbi:MAG: Fic family protein [Deltaproteobacteria bacterium]|nr:Fic family protein [Deltaproteobacteria bacterium]